MIKLIIFDLDGILVDTEHIHYTALCTSITSITGLSLPEIQTVIYTDGSTTKSKLRKLQSVYGFSDSISNQINDLKQTTARAVLSRLSGNAVQHNMLATLSKEYILAVGSNSRKENVNVIIDCLGIRQYFTHIVDIDDVLVEKPDPAIFNGIIAATGIERHQTLILEDSPRGIEAARATGSHVLVSTVEKTTLGNIEHAINKIKTHNSSPDGRAWFEVL